MQLVFFTDGRFFKDSKGRVYNMTGGIPKSLWARYFQYFDKIILVARVLTDSKIEGEPLYEVPQEHVVVYELPYYLGFSHYLSVALKYRNKIKKAVALYGRENNTVFLARVPSMAGSTAAYYLKRKNIPYGVEVVGDPWDAFSPGCVNHPLRPLLRFRGWLELKKVTKSAAVGLYVTKNALQRRYPLANDAKSFGISDVQISSDLLDITKTRCYFDGGRTLKLISVGNLSLMNKSPDVVLKAVAILKNRSIPIFLTWVGGGQLLEVLKNMAKRLGVSNCVNFIGNQPRSRVVEELKKNDIFILVSRQEGLPRAMVEAMATGLACIGSDRGGIPELIDSSFIVPVNEVQSLADKIESLFRHPKSIAQQGFRNFEKAKTFDESALSLRREDFFRALMEI